MDVLKERNVMISLICPSISLSKVVQFIALQDQRIDLGLISTTFGLDPLTIKINGHFISRGVDFIASSVTWKSLVSFFSARGLSTGISATEPLRVDGKLCKVGTKRVHDTAGAENIIYGISEWGNKQPLDTDLNFFKKSKFMGSQWILILQTTYMVVKRIGRPLGSWIDSSLDDIAAAAAFPALERVLQRERAALELERAQESACKL